MKFESTKEKLQGAISLAEKIIGKNMTLPVLGCIYLEAGKNEVVLKATNLDLGIEISIPAKVETEGIVAIPGTILNSFVGSIKGDGPIKLHESNLNLNITTSRNSTVIKAMQHEDFPKIPRVHDGITFSIAANILTEGLKSVWYCSSVSSIKPELASVYVYSNAGQIIFAATDSFRLAEKRLIAQDVADFGQMLIPHKNIPEIIRILERAEKSTIEVSLSKNQVSFSFNGVFLVSRIVDGVFPDYKQIIPKESKTDVTILKQDLIDALKLSNIFSDKFNQVSMKIVASPAHFEVTTKNKEVGENVNTIDAVITGEDVEINFNHRYILDCFQSITTDSVSLQFNGLSRPMVIRPIGDTSFMYLAMPMNR